MSLRRTAILVVLTVALAASTTVAPTAGAEPGRSAAERSARAALAAAEKALDHPDQAHDLTLTMRDLFVQKQALRGADRVSAQRLLARPTDPPDDAQDPRDIYYGEDADLQSRCGETFCLHWVEAGEHAATPEFADTAFSILEDVAALYLAAGLRAPLGDEGQEGSTAFDVYLGEIGEFGATGFCRSDADGPVTGSAWYSYCGFDNDFAEFPYIDPVSLLKVTVAHEYFHAVQFAYDAEDDGWLMESTATWIEDEVYDEVNDNAFFLNFGQMGDPVAFGYPLAGPAIPLDTYDFTAYGNWGFWRHLTETHPDATAGIPNLVREIWEALDTTQGPNDRTSLDALDAVLAARGTSTPDAYAGFAVANQDPTAHYAEAAALGYPTAPDAFDPVQLARSAPTARRDVTLDHLTSASGRVLPFAGSRGLRVRVDLPATATGARAAVVLHQTDGTSHTTWVTTNRQGQGDAHVPFDTATVASVEVTLANGSRSGTHDGAVATVRFTALG